MCLPSAWIMIRGVLGSSPALGSLLSWEYANPSHSAVFSYSSLSHTHVSLSVVSQINKISIKNFKRKQLKTGNDPSVHLRVNGQVRNAIYSDRKQIIGCLGMGSGGGSTKGQEDTFRDGDVNLTVVMVSQVYSQGNIYQVLKLNMCIIQVDHTSKFRGFGGLLCCLGGGLPCLLLTVWSHHY